MESYSSGATFPSMLKTPSVAINFILAPAASASFNFASRSVHETALNKIHLYTFLLTDIVYYKTELR